MAVVLLYLVMVAQFHSFLDPFIIMFAVPMGLIGVIWTLYLTGTTLNIESFMGIIVMVGIVVSNSILFVDFANQAPGDGSVFAAGRSRIRTDSYAPDPDDSVGDCSWVVTTRAETRRRFGSFSTSGPRGSRRSRGFHRANADTGAHYLRAILFSPQGRIMNAFSTVWCLPWLLFAVTACHTPPPPTRPK